jgi:uncharacterized damage-inducible protein DinB
MTEANLSSRLPDPSDPIASTTEVFLRYLGYFRGALAARLRALPEGALTSSRVPSGWTPLELLKHVTYVEMRWLDWGFAGQDVGDPWGDQEDDRWRLAPGDTLDSLLADQERRAARSEQIITGHALTDVGQPGERWDGDPPATLERVLFHLLQEHARHLGHLDIVAELAGGTTGE